MADSTRPSEEGNASEIRKAKRREYARRYYLQNKEKILKRTREWIAKNKDWHGSLCLSYRISHKDQESDRSRRWRLKNPEKAAACQKRYRDRNKELLKAKRDQKKEQTRARSKAHYAKNRGKYLLSRKEYRLNNKAKVSAIGKAHYAKNKEKINERQRQYRARSRDLTRERNRKYQRRRLKEDVCYRLRMQVGRRMRDALTGQSSKKHGRTLFLIGCSAEQLAKHLESRFLPGMCWENYGYHGWHIDHIIPLAKFDLSDPAQQTAAFHYTNLQPLWAKDNLRKRDKVCGQQCFGFAYAARIADGVKSSKKRGRPKYA